MFRTPPKYGMSSYSRVASEMLGCTPWMGALTLLCALLQKAKLLPVNVISQSTNSWAALSEWNLTLIDLFERDTWSSSSRCSRSWASSIAWRSSLFLIGGNPRSLGYSEFSRCPSTCRCFSWMPHFVIHLNCCCYCSSIVGHVKGFVICGGGALVDYGLIEGWLSCGYLQCLRICRCLRGFGLCVFRGSNFNHLQSGFDLSIKFIFWCLSFCSRLYFCFWLYASVIVGEIIIQRRLFVTGFR